MIGLNSELHEREASGRPVNLDVRFIIDILARLRDIRFMRRVVFTVRLPRISR